MRPAGASSRCVDASDFQSCLTLPFATSAILRPMRSHDGAVAVCRRKQNGSPWRHRRAALEIFSIPEDYIRLRRPAPVSISCMEIVGNGLPVPISAIRGTNHFQAHLVNTTENSCAAKSSFAEVRALHLTIMCARLIAIFSIRQLVGSSLEFAWQLETFSPSFDLRGA